MNPLDIDTSLGHAELRRGVVALAVLLNLRQENHGYAVRIALADKGLALKEGTIYPLLRRLESQGFLNGRWDARGDRLRKYYSLTPLGNRALNAMQEQWTRLVSVVDSVGAEACLQVAQTERCLDDVV